MNNMDLDSMTDKELMEIARRRVKLKSRLLLSVIAYGMLNFFMILVWLFALAESFWPKWVMLGTGLLLLIYGAFVFIEIGSIANPDKVVAEFKRLKQTQRKNSESEKPEKPEKSEEET